ncbi:MAG: ABC transporter substrate-binding protein [Porticoccaceae bacterium]|nr:ABC transporter substrate-binding protein [Porticoccaceae bacterium]
MKILQARLTVLALCWVSLLFTAQVQASCFAPETSVEAAALTPSQIIETVTVDVLAEIERHRAGRDDSADEKLKAQHFDCFLDQVDSILGGVVDFDWIALKVMGGYGKTASSEQKALFVETFRSGLVDTYGRGLLSYSSQEIVLLPAEPVGEKRKVTVRQLIAGDDASYPLAYTMGFKNGQWKVINVVINGINMGKSFRKQFVDASEKNEGDIDKVIASWGSGYNNG